MAEGERYTANVAVEHRRAAALRALISRKGCMALRTVRTYAVIMPMAVLLRTKDEALSELAKHVMYSRLTIGQAVDGFIANNLDQLYRVCVENHIKRDSDRRGYLSFRARQIGEKSPVTQLFAVYVYESAKS